MLAFLKSAATPADLSAMLLTLTGILALILGGTYAPGANAAIYLDNTLQAVLPLNQPVTREFKGRLGPVAIDVKNGAARIREYDSPRLIGTKTGWIKNSGQVAACVPCGLLIKIQGQGLHSGKNDFDAVAR